MTSPLRQWSALIGLAAITCAQSTAFADKACEASWAKVDSCTSDKDPACLRPLPYNEDPEAKKWAIGFDYRRDGCLPSAGVSFDGKPNPGIKLGGTTDGHCAWKNQLEYSNTYYRQKCVVWSPAGEPRNKTYCARMYAQYFVKDQTGNGCITGPACGHRNDWEFGMVWTTDGELTHASISVHGDVETKKVGDVRHDGDTVYMVYRKKASTHTMTFAENGEKPVNPTCNWFTPPIVTWDLMHGGAKADNSYLKGVLNTYDYGRAITPFNDKNFVSNIRKGLPKSYPPANLW
jgi:hypothetical protein